MNNLIQTINGFDLLIGSACLMIGLFIGSANEAKQRKAKMNQFLNWVDGETIESQMKRDGWNFPTNHPAGKKLKTK